MTYLTRLDTSRMYIGLTSEQRLARITADLDAQRANRRAATDDYNRDISQRNVADLEAALERAKANEEARTAHLARLEAEEAAKRKEHDDRALAEVTDQLRTRYLQQPGTDEAGFQRALPRLLERQREEITLGAQSERDRQVAETKRRIGNLF